MDFLKTKEAFLILLLTIGTYTSAISFEYGYAFTFNYPKELIYVDSNSLFKSLIYIGLYIFFILATFYTPYPDKNDSIVRTTIRSSISIIAASGVIYILTGDSKLLNTFIIVTIIGLITALIRWLYRKKENGNYYVVWSSAISMISLVLFSFI